MRRRLLPLVFLCVILTASACSDPPKSQPAEPEATPEAEPEGQPEGQPEGEPEAEPEAEPEDPGAIIAVTMESKVGVVLDEIPEGERDSVAAAILDWPAEAWEARAGRQIELMQYRLTFRAYYYDEEDGKGPLNLPPPQVHRIEVDLDTLSRQTIDGHDVVAVDYKMESEIISDVDSVALSEEDLTILGGGWTESFVLPVDPELILQRTGWACMDEAEFPPSSVDAESVSTYFDDLCEVEDEPSKEGCHATLPLPTESCVEALERAVGRVEVDLDFERLPYDAAAAARSRVGEFRAQTADLEPIGEAMENNRIVYKYIGPDDCAAQERCVTGVGWRRLLRFDAFLLNIGREDLHIGDVDYFIEAEDGSTTELGSHNIFEYSACHDHYHFKFYGDFTVTAQGERTIGLKRAFCLETGTRHFNNEETSMVTNYSGCAVQGLTSGWGDEYGANLDCQWIDITNIDTSAGPVTADLSFLANPDRFLCEGEPILDDEGNLTFEATEFMTEAGEAIDRPVCEFPEGWDDNNREARPVEIPQTGGYVTAPCTRGQIGPMRDCGLTEGPTQACVPGEQTTLSCAVAGGPDAPTQVLRLCESSAALGVGTACTFLDALASVVVGAEPVDVTFTCPSARSNVEPGGAFALYRGPLLGGAAPAAISCAAD